jgi:hypothetical protein
MKVVVISGGSSGIGEACCIRFLNSDYCVYNLDTKNNQSLSEYSNYFWLKTDVSIKADVNNSLQTIIKKQKNIDILIISAGKHLSANIEDTLDSEFHQIININLIGAFWLAQAILPYMKINKEGRIITIGSDQSVVAKSNSTVYGMTKSAILSMTKSIALDYAKYNIRANCIGAGTIDTPLYRNAITKYSDKSGIDISTIEKSEALEQPVGRIGKAKEIANLAYFLSQKENNFITGAFIPIDGGYTAR